MRKILFLFLTIITFSLPTFAQKKKKDKPRTKPELQFRATAELGFLAVLSHKIQFSKAGTYFDYVKEGGQDVLFPVGRLSVEMEYGRHTFVFLYQPLAIKSEVLLQNDVTIDGLTFPAGTGMRSLYNFPFYRISYLNEVLPNSERFSFQIGATLQLRNATITFESTDGERFRANRDLGIVPALKVRTGMDIGKSYFAEIEADGIYAPVSYLNGSDEEITGAILDGSIRAGRIVRTADRVFLNLRYLGGGAVGTSDDDPGPGDGYVRNWLHFMTVTLGYSVQF